MCFYHSGVHVSYALKFYLVLVLRLVCTTFTSAMPIFDGGEPANLTVTPSVYLASRTPGERLRLQAVEIEFLEPTAESDVSMKKEDIVEQIQQYLGRTKDGFRPLNPKLDPADAKGEPFRNNQGFVNFKIRFKQHQASDFAEKEWQEWHTADIYSPFPFTPTDFHVYQNKPSQVGQSTKVGYLLKLEDNIVAMKAVGVMKRYILHRAPILSTKLYKFEVKLGQGSFPHVEKVANLRVSDFEIRLRFYFTQVALVLGFHATFDDAQGEAWSFKDKSGKERIPFQFKLTEDATVPYFTKWTEWHEGTMVNDDKMGDFVVYDKVPDVLAIQMVNMKIWVSPPKPST
ncbi:hypothetical protein J3R30DRAFT_3441899 [Lentinula aciculospora]|uniref:Uncharacterized protein n=1 Tax=Lentinula aciculospora TaxID=153920 RepID=A0A9W9DTV4_9AGAR|nr:hypothetical protein J3R30DRAFT_3441899 [Lentinula aciculospora]